MMMRKTYMLLLLLALGASCSESEPTEQQEVKEEEVSEAPTSTVNSYCFLRTGGNKNEDTAVIKLEIDGNFVTGEMKYLPYERDARTGTVRGNINGETVDLTWHCKQEGMDFEVPVSLKLRDGNAYQKLWAYDDKGEEYLPDTASYGLMYRPMHCSEFPVKLY